MQVQDYWVVSKFEISEQIKAKMSDISTDANKENPGKGEAPSATSSARGLKKDEPIEKEGQAMECTPKLRQIK
jgi:hypothetical protein